MKLKEIVLFAVGISVGTIVGYMFGGPGSNRTFLGYEVEFQVGERSAGFEIKLDHQRPFISITGEKARDQDQIIIQIDDLYQEKGVIITLNNTSIMKSAWYRIEDGYAYGISDDNGDGQAERWAWAELHTNNRGTEEIIWPSIPTQ